uniref:RING-type domain-containing protein n=1 Tax=viral metagenome TaxID=1070528 RepID=A0A6C0KUD3_9ZZZZ
MSSSIIQVNASKKIQSSFRANRTKKLAATQKIQSGFRGSRSRRAVKLLKETIKETNECPLCLEPMKKNITIALPCGHIFHTKCIKQALIYNNKCPNCRRVITNVSLQTRSITRARTRTRRTFRNLIFRPLQMLRNLYNARTINNRQTQDNNTNSVIEALQESIAANEAVKVIEQRIATILARTTRATTRTATQRRRISIKDLQIEELNLRAARERYRLANERAEAMYNALPESQRLH